MKQWIIMWLSVCLMILCCACHPSVQTPSEQAQAGVQGTQPLPSETDPDDMMTTGPTDPTDPDATMWTEPTEPPTEEPTSPPTEEPTDPPTEPLTEPPTQPSYDAPVLTAEVEDMIKTAYMATDSSVDYTKDDLTVEYYGEYEGAHIAIVDGPWDSPGWMQTEIVAGVEFVYSSGSRELKVYKDGERMSLQEALDTGWLSEASIHELWGYYKFVNG